LEALAPRQLLLRPLANLRPGPLERRRHLRLVHLPRFVPSSHVASPSPGGAQKIRSPPDSTISPPGSDKPTPSNGSPHLLPRHALSAHILAARRQQSTAFGGFGQAAPAFGATSAPAFGAPAATAFGATPQQPAFGGGFGGGSAFGKCPSSAHRAYTHNTALFHTRWEKKSGRGKGTPSPSLIPACNFLATAHHRPGTHQP
jgi:hypothetical protein